MSVAGPPVEGLARPAPPPRRLRSDIGLMVVNKVLGLALHLASTVVLARELGPHGRGIVAVAFGFTLTLAQLGTFGIASANPYFVALDQRRRIHIVSNLVWLCAIIGIALIAS